MEHLVVSAAFDPWTATQSDAVRAAELDPEALAQHQAAQAVLHAQDECLAPGGGCAVLKAMSQCLAAGLMPPQWLSDHFIALYALVGDAQVGSWDKVFGKPFPPHTRLHDLRKHRRLRKAVHAAVFQAVIEEDESVGIELFARIAKRRQDLCLSASTCRDRYYEALAEGMPNPVHVREAFERSTYRDSSPLFHAFSNLPGTPSLGVG